MAPTNENDQSSPVTVCPFGHSDENPDVSSILSTIIATQPSFKKLFISSAPFLNNYKSSSIPSRLLSSPRWSRNRSSKQFQQIPTTIQINAGKRIIKKYRLFARNLEYNRLRSIIPSLSKRKYTSKARILHEAIKYIDSLHQQLVTSIQTKGLPPILQNMKSDLHHLHDKHLQQAPSTTNSSASGHQFEVRHIQSRHSENNPSSLPTISRSETISMIQTALQPEIEKRLDARRKMDKLAMEALLLFSDSKQCSSKRKQSALDPEHQETNVYKKYTSDEEDSK